MKSEELFRKLQISIKATSFNVVTSSQTINVNFPILYHKVIYETGTNLGTKWSISVYNSVVGSTYDSVNVSSGSSLSTFGQWNIYIRS